MTLILPLPDPSFAAHDHCWLLCRSDLLHPQTRRQQQRQLPNPAPKSHSAKTPDCCRAEHVLCPSKSPGPCQVGTADPVWVGKLGCVWEAVCCHWGPCSQWSSCQTPVLGFSASALCYFDAGWSCAKWVQGISVILSLLKKGGGGRGERKGGEKMTLPCKS